MLNWLQDNKNLHITPEGSTMEMKFHTTKDEYFAGFCTNNDTGATQRIPRIGDEWAIASNMVGSTLKVTDIQDRTLVGVFECDVNGQPILDEQHQATEVTITYSDIASKLDAKRANQAGSWWIKWDSQLEDVDQECYYHITTPASGPSSAGTWKIWSDEYFAVNGAALKALYGYTDEEMAEMKKNKSCPRLSYKMPILYVTITSYTNQLRGQQFALANGSVNSTGLIDWTYEQRLAAAQALQRSTSGVYAPITTALPYSTTWDDTGRFLMVSFAINEKNLGMLEYSATFRFNAMLWNTSHGITTNMYPTYDFRQLYTGMSRTDPVLE